MMTSQALDDASLQENPYLALREANIRRNEDRLRALGLGPSVTNLRASVNNTQQQSKHVSSAKDSSQKSLRRSKRLLNQHHAILNDNETTNGGTLDKSPRKNPARVQTPPTYSVRSFSICTQLLIKGHSDEKPYSCRSGFLGVPMRETGKEFVIYASFDLAVSPEVVKSLEGSRVSFNKYSGVQEWHDCIFLWVNFGAKGGDNVVNEFLNGGKQITWFGGSRMVDDKPIVEKLIRWGKEATDWDSKIVLWCRSYDDATNKFRPYVCLGRLSYHTHTPGSRPLAFIWNLLDYDKLINNSNGRVVRTFRRFLTYSSC